MKSWEKFEQKCTSYLTEQYSEKYGCKFVRTGGSDSTHPDICVTTKNGKRFYIEVKMSNAQCGQFVAIPNEGSITYSTNNHPNEPSEYSRDIINCMNKDFDKYKNPTTHGINVKIDSMLCYNWIIDHYKNDLKCKYVITEGKNGFILFKIDSISKYFNVTAIYRKKKSGSTNPTTKHRDEIEKLLQQSHLTYENLNFNHKHLEVCIDCPCETFKLYGEEHTYFFRKIDNSIYRITRLSNTNNPNVIFEISLKPSVVQSNDELIQFIAELS